MKKRKKSETASPIGDRLLTVREAAEVLLFSAKISSDLTQQFLPASIHGAARREHP